MDLFKAIFSNSESDSSDSSDEEIQNKAGALDAAAPVVSAVATTSQTTVPVVTQSQPAQHVDTTASNSSMYTMVTTILQSMSYKSGKLYSVKSKEYDIMLVLYLAVIHLRWLCSCITAKYSSRIISTSVS